MGQTNSTSKFIYNGPPLTTLFTPELFLKLFQYLSPGELCFIIIPVCKLFSCLASKDNIWEKFVNEKYKNEKNLKNIYISWVRNQAKLGLENKVNVFHLSGETNPVSLTNQFRFVFYLIGSFTCGKTTLVHSFTGKNVTNESVSAYTTFTIKEKCDARIILFDFHESDSANEQVLIKSDYKNTHAILICFDLTNAASYERSKETLKEISLRTIGGLAVVAVGTKADLVNQHKVHASEPKEYFSKLGLPYYEVNCKNVEDVKALFANISKYILQPLEPLPKWLPNPQHLGSNKEKIVYLKWGANLQS